MQEDTHTLLFLHEERQLLLLSFNSQLLLLETMKEEKRTSSHEHPVTCVLYNSLFRQVVSSDLASSVICWQADTGQKVKQFHHCHGNSEISTMALDGTQTRLFTAGTDGEVKVWDFNGRCLHRMNAGQGRAVEISQILLLKRSILVMGWDRMLTVFRLHSFSQSFVEPSEWKGGVQHRSDVLCAAFQPPQTLVTGWCVLSNNDYSHPGANSKEDSDNSIAISQLIFIPGRSSAAAATGGADLISCGGSGVVRLWSTTHSRLVGQFTAHSKDLGSIVMNVSPCGKYLVTADSEGTLKTWDIQVGVCYICTIYDATTREPPELLCAFRPHLDRVTHLDMCNHGDRLLLFSASADCSVALSYLPGATIDFWGFLCLYWRDRTVARERERDRERERVGNGMRDISHRSNSNPCRLPLGLQLRHGARALTTAPLPHQHPTVQVFYQNLFSAGMKMIPIFQSIRKIKMATLSLPGNFFL
uniref:WD repeat domain 49 n=1 Tax=Labrus bergylta TaxID=56723 RepID=A0A3Q3F0E0_9LABR